MKALNHVDQPSVSIREMIKLLVIVAALLCTLSPNPVVIWWRFVFGF
jgi:hypothetical protein